MGRCEDVHHDAFTHGRFDAEIIFLHTHTQFTHIFYPRSRRHFTHRLCYTRTLLPDAFKHRPCYKHFYIQTPLHTHSRFYTQTLLHITLLHNNSCAHRHFYTQMRLHTDAFTHRQFHTHRSFYSQMLVHANAFTHTHTCDLLHRSPKIRTNAFSHKETFTSRPCYIQTLLHGRCGETSQLIGSLQKQKLARKKITESDDCLSSSSILPAQKDDATFYLPRWSCHQTFRFPHSL